MVKDSVSACIVRGKQSWKTRCAHLGGNLGAVRGAKCLFEVLLGRYLALGYVEKDILDLDDFIQVLLAVDAGMGSGEKVSNSVLNHSVCYVIVDSLARPPLADLVLVAGNLEALAALLQAHDGHIRQLDLVGGWSGKVERAMETKGR